MRHSPSFPRLKISALAAAALAALAGPASAAERYWGYAPGCSVADFKSTSCWRLGAPGESGGGTVGTPPAADDSVYLIQSAATELTVNLANGATPLLPVYWNLTLRGTGAGAAGLSIARNKLEVSNDTYVGDGGKGHITQIGGTAKFNYLYLGWGGSGEYTMSGGDMSFASLLVGGTSVVSQAGGTIQGGSMQLYGGSRYYLDAGTLDMRGGTFGGGAVTGLGTLELGGGQLLTNVGQEVKVGTLNFIGGDGDMLKNAKVNVNTFNVRNDYGPYRFATLTKDVKANTLNVGGVSGNNSDANFSGGTHAVNGTMTVSAGAGNTSRAFIQNSGTSMTVNGLEVGRGDPLATGDGRVLVNYGGSLVVNGTANVGRADKLSSNSYLGAQLGGQITVNGPLNVYGGALATGAGSSLTVNGDTTVGNSGRNSWLTVDSGGQFTGANLHVQTGSVVTLSDGGRMQGDSLSNDGTMRFSGTGGTLAYAYFRNSGQVTVDATARAVFGHYVDSGGTGAMDIKPGGVAHFDGFVSRMGPAGFTGGGTSEYAGTVGLGLQSGDISDAGDFTLLDGATMMLDFNPAGGRLKVGGTLSFAGTLALSNWYVTPVAGDSYAVFEWGTRTGSFSSFDYSDAHLAPGLAWDMTELYTEGVIKVSAVPEPSSLALVLAGIGAVGCITRRRRSKLG